MNQSFFKRKDTYSFKVKFFGVTHVHHNSRSRILIVVLISFLLKCFVLKIESALLVTYCSFKTRNWRGANCFVLLAKYVGKLSGVLAMMGINLFLFQ